MCRSRKWRAPASGFEFVRVRELQIMARHRFVHGQIAHEEIVVLAKERILLLLRPIFWRRRDRKKCFAVLFQRSGRIAIGDGHAALELRHGNDVERHGRHRHQIVLLHEVGRFIHDFLGVANDRVVVLMLLGQFV